LPNLWATLALKGVLEMGSSFVGYALAIDKGVKPRFFKIYPDSPFITKYCEWQEQVNGISDYSADNSKEDVAELLNDAMERVHDAWEDRTADTMICHFSKQSMLFTGGETWGDSPSETFEAIDCLYQADLLKEIGFEF
jgi:hypothetical protein